MWEIYIEPTLKEQEASSLGQESTADTRASAPSGPATLEETIAAAVSIGMRFGKDPLEVAKAVRKSWGRKGAKK